MRIAIIDDNMDYVDSFREVIDDAVPDSVVRVFECPFDAKDWSADLAIVDVSSVVPISMWHTAASSLASYCSRHPGTQIIIMSGLPTSFLLEIADELREMCPESRITVADCRDLYNHLQDILK